MPFSMKKPVRIGPIKLNYTLNGLSSWSFIMPFTGERISWNSRTRKWSFNLPGPVNYKTKGGRKK